ncbi:Dephospho-CoA kinase [Arenibacter antarcticus]|uniref:Dephospho-CoA kinase n=1 Tax=Arenibacter antarcticus TaxID=2040469 RepID=A0ABW5VEP1_9FLAO|nr:dephospho-CoA kinase [Arenibacter sp. H213]MCM4169743.1 dephospho-CoA kinase [Arenibacter sp. H213]
MKIVGLTGGIGSGKSTVAGMFRELGVPVYNSDEEAKELMGNSDHIKQQIVTLLGEDSYDGRVLNRTYISQRVFKDSELLKALNDIVHPAVRNHFKEWARNQNSDYVIQEAAIIFENGTHNLYDQIILVTAPLNIRINRVVQRDGVSTEQVMERVKNQWEDNRKVPLANFVIENSEIQKTAGQVASIHQKLLKTKC